MKSVAELRAIARALLALDAVSRVGVEPASDLDLAGIIYFTDAFAPLWGIEPLSATRAKGTLHQISHVRAAVDFLVCGEFVVPADISLVEGSFHATYGIDPARSAPVLHRVTETAAGKHEAACTYEVVLAAASLFGRFPEAVELDASSVTDELGPRDVIDFDADSVPTTSRTAKNFLPAASTRTKRVAEMTHLYLGHLERMLSRGA